MSRPTIVDVAERAGVSKSLVSLVMRNAGRVSPERRAAVLEAARELGYRPNAVARSLVRQRSHVLGVMLSDLHNTYFADCVDGIDERAEAQDYRTILTTGHLVSDREIRAIETLLELQVDGLLLVGSTAATSAIREVSRELPIVLVTRATRVDTVDSVVNDDRAGAGLVVDHLADLGHRQIAHVDGGRGAGAPQRRGGYERAMTRRGLRPRVVGGAFTREGGIRGMRELLVAGQRPTAVFVANDLAATGALEVIDRAGLRVPDDISVVGYDDTHVAGSARYDLTTVDQPRRRMGRTAVSLLLERLRGERAAPRHVVLAPSLVVRGSTGPPAD